MGGSVVDAADEVRVDVLDWVELVESVCLVASVVVVVVVFFSLRGASLIRPASLRWWSSRRLRMRRAYRCKQQATDMYSAFQPVTYLCIMRVLGSIMEGARGLVVLLPRGEDAVGQGGRRSGASVVVGVSEMCGLHGGGGDGGGERISCSVVVVVAARVMLAREGRWVTAAAGIKRPMQLWSRSPGCMARPLRGDVGIGGHEQQAPSFSFPDCADCVVYDQHQRTVGKLRNLSLVSSHLP